MDTPLYIDKQYIDQNLFNNNASYQNESIAEAMIQLCGTGLLNADSTMFSVPSMVATITFAADFMILFDYPQTAMSGAHGTTPNSDTQIYTVNLASYVPPTGTQTVYI